jgi:hypothetical protein
MVLYLHPRLETRAEKTLKHWFNPAERWSRHADDPAVWKRGWRTVSAAGLLAKRRWPADPLLQDLLLEHYGYYTEVVECTLAALLRRKENGTAGEKGRREFEDTDSRLCIVVALHPTLEMHFHLVTAYIPARLQTRPSWVAREELDVHEGDDEDEDHEEIERAAVRRRARWS